jgi:uncharacterized membrane protein YfcA
VKGLQQDKSNGGKFLAILVMTLLGGWLWAYGNLPTWLTLLIVAVMGGAGAFVGSRPGTPR